MAKVLIICIVLVLAAGIAAHYFMRRDDKQKAEAPGNAAEYDLDNVEVNEESVLNGKNILFLGSSVTYGAASQGVSFVDYIEKMDHVQATKEAASGTTLVDSFSFSAFLGFGEGRSYVARLNRADKSKAYDAVVVQLSTNDATTGKDLGEISESFSADDFDTKTITGAIEYIIAYSRDTWNCPVVFCPVVFYTGAYFDSEAYSAMADRLLELQEKWGIGVIDLYHDEELNNIDEETYNLYMYDEIHPTKAGYLEWWTPVIESYLCDYLQ